MEQTTYTHHLRVNYKDTDQMGVAHHANYVSWLEIARTEMMRNDGIAYKDMEDLGLLLPVLDVHIQYRNPAYYDDLLAISTNITKFSSARLQFSYEIRRVTEDAEQANEGELLSTGTTLHMWLTKEWRPARLHKVAPNIFSMLKEKYEISNE